MRPFWLSEVLSLTANTMPRMAYPRQLATQQTVTSTLTRFQRNPEPSLDIHVREQLLTTGAEN